MKVLVNFSPPFGTFYFFAFYPALKRRAIFVDPFGIKDWNFKNVGLRQKTILQKFSMLRLITNPTIRIFILFALVSQTAFSKEPVAKQFLRHIYGADGINIAQICVPSEDLWMLRGAKDTNALATVDAMKPHSFKDTGVFTAMVRNDISFIEIRDGRIDPTFNLEGIYNLHRKLVLTFIYASLTHDQALLKRLATDASKVKTTGPKDAPPSGDMDVYEGLIEAMPVVRSSKPSDDLKSKTITYRVPVGNAGLSLTLIKEGSNWKIDTSRSVKVPIEFFYQ